MVCQDCGNVDVLSLLLQSPRLSSLFFGMKSQHSTDSMFYSFLLQAASSSRLLCSSSSFASWCAKTVAIWMYCLYWFNHPDSLRCFLAWKVNIQLSLCFTPSSLFLASSVLFLQSCLHHAKGLWQCGCIVWIDSTTQTLFAVFWHEKSTFNWFYVLLQAASSSRLLCSSSNRAYIMRQDSGNVDVLSLLIQPPRLSSMFFGMKSQHSTDSMFYSKQPLPRIFCALPPIVPTSYVKTLTMWMYCLYCFNHLDSLRCFLAWKVNIQLTLLQAASSSCLLCSSSSFAYMVCQDCGNVDVLALLLQSPRLSSLFFGMKSQHSTDSTFYSKQPLPRVFCALPPVSPTWCAKTVAMWMYCLYCFNHPDSPRCFLAWKVNIQLTLCSTPSSLFLASSVLFLQSCLHHAKGLWQCGCIVWIDSTTQTLFAVFWHEKSTFNWLYVLLQAASSSRLPCSSSNRAYIMRKDSDNVDVLSELIQPPRLSSLLFGMKSQHSTESMFYSKQPLPRVFCALPPIVPTSCVKTLAMWMYCLYWFNHPDSLRCFLAWKVNIQLTLCFTPSSLFLASSVLFLQSCLHHASRLWQCGCIVFIDSTTQTLFAVIWHEKSTFNMTLCSTPSSLFLASSVLFLQSCLHHASRLWQCGCIVFIASTTQTLLAVFWHEKSTFKWLYVLLQAASTSRLLCSSSNRAYIMRQDSGNVDALSLLAHHPDSFRCFLAWKVNIQLTLCSTPSSLFLASSVLFLQSCLRHASRLWQCGCIVFIDSTTQTLFAVIWHEKSTFKWLYVLLQAASTSRLLCSSSNRAYIMRQDSGNVDVLSLLIQPPRLFRCFLAWKVNIQLTLCSTPSRLFLTSFVLFLQSCLHHASRLWQCGCIVFIDSTTQTLFAVFWHERSTFNWLYVLLQAASSSRLRCSSSNRAYIMRQDSGNVDVLSLLLQPPRLFRCFLAWKVNIQLTLCSTPSSLFLTSFVLFLQSCLHHTSRLWQCGCIVFIASTTQTLLAVFWHEKSTFNWLYVLLQAASSSRLLCSSSNRAYIMRQDSGNVDVLLIQPPRLFSLFFGMKSQHSTDSMFYSSSLFLASSVLFLQSCLHHTSRLWQCGCIVFTDSITQTLFDVFWHVKSTFNWLYVLLQAASSSRLLCSSSNRAYIMRQDSGNVDVLSSLIQPPRLSSLFFGMKSQHSTDSMFYSFLLQAASFSRLLCSSSNCAYIMRKDSNNVNLSLLLQPPRLSSMFFGM